MSYVIDFTKSALEDLEKHKKSGDLKILRKIAVLLTELLILPLTGTGHPELLKNEIKETYSRRINKKHRLVYRIKEETVTVIVLSAFAHYCDK